MNAFDTPLFHLEQPLNDLLLFSFVRSVFQLITRKFRIGLGFTWSRDVIGVNLLKFV